MEEEINRRIGEEVQNSQDEMNNG